MFGAFVLSTALLQVAELMAMLPASSRLPVTVTSTRWPYFKAPAVTATDTTLGMKHSSRPVRLAFARGS